jgi:hypothetical protein
VVYPIGLPGRSCNADKQARSPALVAWVEDLPDRKKKKEAPVQEPVYVCVGRCTGQIS